MARRRAQRATIVAEPTSRRGYWQVSAHFHAHGVDDEVRRVKGAQAAQKALTRAIRNALSRGFRVTATSYKSNGEHAWTVAYRVDSRGTVVQSAPKRTQAKLSRFVR